METKLKIEMTSSKIEERIGNLKLFIEKTLRTESEIPYQAREFKLIKQLYDDSLTAIKREQKRLIKMKLHHAACKRLYREFLKGAK